MPHECTNCGRTFPDGSKEMLSGCPDCGGNKFQFTPSRSSASDSSDGSTSDSESAVTDDADEDAGWDSESGFTRATETVRNWVTSSDDGDQSQSTIDETPSAATADDPSRTPPESAQSTEATGADGQPSSGSWPSSDGPAPDPSSQDPPESQEPPEFEEWPETARRPEDRSSSATDASTPTDDRSSASTDEGTSTAGDGPTSSPPDPASSMRSNDRSSGQQSPPGPSSDSSRSIDSSPTDDSIDDARTPIADSEDSAQADARSGVVSNDDIPTGTVEGTAGDDSSRDGAGRLEDADVDASDDEEAPEHGRVVSEPTGEQPSIEELRAELNEQFESIKIVSPGQYELNLMELYNREEYIISLQEDGRYVIDVPDSWREADDE